MPRVLPLWCLCLLTILCPLAVARPAAGEKLAAVSLPDIPIRHDRGIATDPATGEVYIMGNDSHVYAFAPAYFMGDESGVRERAVGAHIDDNRFGLLFKRYRGTPYLIFPVADKGRVEVWRADTLEPVATLPLPPNYGPQAPFASGAADDPLVFIPTTGQADGWLMMRLDRLGAAAESGAREPFTVLTPDTRGGSASADGQWVYPWEYSVGWEKTNLYRLHPPDEASTQPAREADVLAPAAAAAVDHRSPDQRIDRGHKIAPPTGPMLPGPRGRLVARGGVVYRADLSERVAALEHRVMAFTPDGGAVLTLGTDREAGEMVLTAYAASDFSTLGRVTFSGDGKSDGPYITSTEHEQAVVADGDRGRVVVIAERKAIAVPYDRLGLTDVKPLVVEVAGDTLLAMGKPARLPLSTSAPGLKATLTEAPRGVYLAQGALHWTPGPMDAGDHRVLLRLTRGDDSATQAIRLLVRRPSVQLTHAPTHLTPLPDGRRLLAWSRGENHLAVVDLEAMRITATATLPVKVQDLAANDEHVFLSPREATLINVHRLADLELVKQTMTKAPAWMLHVLGNEAVVATLRHSGSHTEAAAFAPPQMTPLALGEGRLSLLVSDPRSTRGLGLSEEGDSLMRAEMGGWLWGPYVLDEAMREVMMISYPPVGQRRDTDTRYGTISDPVLPWNRTIQPGHGYRSQTQLRSFRPGEDVAAMAALEAVVLSASPAAASLEPTHADDRNPRGVDLVYRDLVKGEEVRRVPLSAEPTPQPEAVGLMEVEAGRVVARVGDRLYTDTLPGEARKALPVPLHFEPRQPKLVLPATGRATLEHQARGGSGPASYALIRPTAGLTVDQKTGTVTVDVDAAAEAVMRYQAPAFNREPYLLPPLAEAVKGVPGSLGVELEATDAAGDKAALKYHLVLDLDEAKVKAADEEDEARRREMQERHGEGGV